jgi:hypothetical protein
MTYESLLTEADSLGLIVKEVDFKTYDGLCKGNRIGINKNLKTDKEKKCILAEEISHYKLTVGDISDLSKIENMKQEIKARREGYDKLVGITRIINAFEHGVKSLYEMSDFLDVTEEFLEDAIKYYKIKYGTYFEIDNYLICFEPNLQIIKKF